MEYFLRFLLCVLRWALIVVVVLALSVGAFLFAMDYANVTILATDGMKMRAGVVLGYNDADELTKFFTEDYLAGDELLKDTTYLDYTINSFDAQVDVESLHTLPWETTATVVVTESVTIPRRAPHQQADARAAGRPQQDPAPALGRRNLRADAAEGRRAPLDHHRRGQDRVGGAGSVRGGRRCGLRRGACSLRPWRA